MPSIQRLIIIIGTIRPPMNKIMDVEMHNRVLKMLCGIMSVNLFLAVKY